jgi:hypothetical protein
MAKKAVSKKAATKQAATKKGSAGRKSGTTSAAEGRLVATAKVVGRTLGRAAKGIDRASSVVKKKAAAFKRGKKSTGKRKKDPVVEEKRARVRANWKAQEKASSAVEMAQTNTLVDERARVRATTGMSWSNRKPR